MRPLEYADLPVVVAIERRAFSAPWSLSMFVLEIAKPGGIYLAALRTGGAASPLCGYLVCARYLDVWHLMNVAVDPKLRRRGVGGALLERMFEVAGDGEQRFTLEVRASNRGAIEMYQRRGFVAVGVRRRYYQDNGEDAVVMWRGEPDG